MIETYFRLKLITDYIIPLGILGLFGLCCFALFVYIKWCEWKNHRRIKHTSGRDKAESEDKEWTQLLR